MKNLTAILVLVLSPILSLASTASVSCQSLSGDDKSLVLLVSENKAVKIKVQTQGSLPKVLAVNEIRNDGSVSVYSISGISALLEVQNTILAGQGGRAKLAGQRFECESN